MKENESTRLYRKDSEKNELKFILIFMNVKVNFCRWKLIKPSKTRLESLSIEKSLWRKILCRYT